MQKYRRNAILGWLFWNDVFVITNMFEQKGLKLLVCAPCTGSHNLNECCGNFVLYHRDQTFVDEVLNHGCIRLFVIVWDMYVVSV